MHCPTPRPWKISYQKTVLESHELLSAHVFMHRIVVGDDTLAICCSLGSWLESMTRN